MKLNFDEFKLGALHEKHAVGNWDLGTISIFLMASHVKHTELLDFWTFPIARCSWE
jgi:hypothetical protein